MSTFEDSAPLVEALREHIREAKRKSGLTIDRLADEAGISRTAVIKLLSNSKIDPKLTDIAALCRYFDLSLDRVFSLHSEAAPPHTPQEVVAQNHALELENARLTASVDAQIADAGIIRGGQLSAAAWILIALILASILAAAFAVLRFLRKELAAQQNEASQKP